MNREIKFRAWDKEKKAMECHDLTGLDSMENALSFYDDIEKPLMQYTGLKDKNGVEIYEGDRVKHDSEDFADGEIKYMLCCFSFYGYHYGYKDNLQDILANCNDKLEVIGNIYENPELLKGESI